MKSETIIRPWGSFIQFTHNETSTVKIIIVKPGEELSLQYHTKRKEFWRILSGNPIVTIGEEKIHATTGQEFVISEKVQHRINGGETGTEILEISTGTFDEDDIIRIEDRYGRA